MPADKRQIFVVMKGMLLILLLTMAANSYAQITVDTAAGIVTVKEKAAGATKTLTIYRTLVPGRSATHQMVYQPDAVEPGEEPPTLVLNMAKELPHLKTLLDAAMRRKQFSFTRISLNLSPYPEMTARLIDAFANSKEWSDYIKKSGSLKHVATLDDGTEVKEIVYDVPLAESILDKSGYAAELISFFAQYGYRVAYGSFAEEHQPVLSPEKLTALGKSSKLVVPVPNSFFLLTKMK